MRKPIVVFSVLLALAGCQTSFNQMEPADRKALIQKEGDSCKAFGYKPGTTAFAQCIQTAIIERDREISQRQSVAIVEAETDSQFCDFYETNQICF